MARGCRRAWSAGVTAVLSPTGRVSTPASPTTWTGSASTSPRSPEPSPRATTRVGGERTLLSPHCSFCLASWPSREPPARELAAGTKCHKEHVRQTCLWLCFWCGCHWGSEGAQGPPGAATATVGSLRMGIAVGRLLQPRRPRPPSQPTGSRVTVVEGHVQSGHVEHHGPFRR